MKHFFRFRKTRAVAKDRLKILLISDRVTCSPKTVDLIRNDIASVLSEYMKIDKEQMEVEIKQVSGREMDEKKPVLYINIPIVDLRPSEKFTHRIP